MPKPIVNKLKEQAKSNTHITKGTSKEQTVLKSGNVLEAPIKQRPAKLSTAPTNTVVGMNKGVTKNMENYESLRVDCWLSTNVLEGETVKEAYTRIETIIDKTLEEAVLNTIEN